MNLSMSLRTAAIRLPNQPAITAGETRQSYGVLEDRVGKLAAGLRSRLNLTPGNRVGLAMENCADYLMILYGIWRAGLVAVPMNAKLHAKEMAFILCNSGCKLCFATSDVAERLGSESRGGLPRIVVAGTPDLERLLVNEPVTTVSSAPEDEAWLFYTSGTTGRPKGAVLSHRNLLFMSHCYYADIDQIDERDVKIHAAPLSHASGLYAIPHLARGSHQIVLAGSFDPDQIYDLLARHQNVTLFGAPTMVSRLVNHDRAGTAAIKNLKTLYFGGAPMYASDLKQALELFGPRLTQIYGQGESPMTITSLPKHLLGQSRHPRREALIASCGFARTGVEVRVVDENGQPAAVEEIGEVITRSDCVMQGYWDNAEANAKSLRDGWLWTGDLGSMDAEGFLTLKDRSKDMIISGGSNIYPRELEEVLLKHPAILECAVIGVPDPEWGEAVTAFVTLRPGQEVGDNELDQLCLDNVARYKRPKSYHRIDSLPKSSYGKILKTELRAQLAANRTRE
ncbi:AMP-binding protein [Bradyrhizobium sp.]|uniref:AMP-binding protein n=1 Tax=Bradyrhizobium sp. TaxID=376 RepID=UPI0025B94D8D|nr:AMP-binding protein [Bradyrhizobium sp.]